MIMWPFSVYKKNVVSVNKLLSRTISPCWTVARIWQRASRAHYASAQSDGMANVTCSGGGTSPYRMSNRCSWEEYVECFECSQQYCLINKLITDDKKRAALHSFCREETYSLIVMVVKPLCPPKVEHKNVTDSVKLKFTQGYLCSMHNASFPSGINCRVNQFQVTSQLYANWPKAEVLEQLNSLWISCFVTGWWLAFPMVLLSSDC